MADPKEEVLGFSIDLKPADAIKAAQLFQKEVTKRLKLVEKSEKNINNGISKLIYKLGGAKKAWLPMLREQLKLQEKIGQEIKRNADTLSEYYKNLEGMSGAAKDKQLSDIKSVEKRLSDLREEAGGLEEGRLKIVSETVFDPKEVGEALKDVGGIFAKPFMSVLAKDLPGVFESSGAVIGQTIQASVKGLTKVHKGVAAGAAASESGKGLKEISGLAGKIGAVLNVISKLGPAIEMVSSLTMGLVKLLVDAEAAAKDYNKQVLATAGTSEFLDRSMGNAASGAAELKASLKDLRDGAMDLSMIQWGISKETAGAFQSALFAEGVSIGRLGDELKKTTGYAQDNASAIQMTVAYSRSFGVSLSDLTQLQGEMMTDMGSSLDGVEASFQDVAQSAAEAGIASNKFFGIVRSFSADLSLFALRMEDVTKVMKTLGKTMSPRDAQKFLQTITQKFTGGITDNLKHVMMSGGGAKGVVKEDLGTKMDALSGDIASAVGKGPTAEIMDLLKDPHRDPRAIAKWQAKQGSKVNGALMGAIQDAAIMADRSAKGDAVDLAAVIDQLSPLGKIALLQKESQKLFNGKKLEELSGKELIAVESTGIATVQELRGFKKLQQGVLAGQEGLIERVRTNNKTSQDIAMLTKLGVDTTKEGSEDAAKHLENIFKGDKGQRQFWDSMTSDQQELLQNGTKAIDFQKETSGFQTSAIDKLGIIADILMNQIYDMMTNIYEVIVKYLPGTNSRFTEFAAKLGKLRDDRISGALDKSGGNVFKAKTEIIETAGKSLLADAQSARKELSAIQDRLVHTENKDEKKALQDQIDKLTDVASFSSITAKQLHKMSPEEFSVNMEELSKAVSKAGVKGEGAYQASTATTTAKVSPASPVTVAKTTKPLQEAVTHQEATADGVDDIHKDMRNRGIKLDKTQLSGPYSDAMEKSMYEAVSTALFEYYMYSAITDRSQVSTALGAGMDPGAFAKRMRNGETPQAVLGGMQTEATRGGGTMKHVVELQLKGDAHKMIKATAQDAVVEHERNKRIR